MQSQWWILGGTGVCSILFMVVLMCRLAYFEGHQSTKRPRKRVEPARVAAAPALESRRRMAVSRGDPEASGKNLRRLLLKLLRANLPASRLAVIEQLRNRAEEFEPGLLEILASPQDELILPAIVAAGDLKLRSALLPMVLLSSSDTPRVRIAAIQMKNRIEPWADNELVRLLGDQDKFVLMTVLRILRQRDHRPVERLFELLSHPSVHVRRAAAGTMPIDQPGVLRRLIRAVQSRIQPAATAAIRGLSRPGLGAEVEAALRLAVAEADVGMATAALEALARQEQPLSSSLELVAVAQDTRRTLKDRALALIALEKTKTPVAGLADRFQSAHPIVRYFAGRCAVATGDRLGLSLLILNLDAKPAATVSEDDATTAARESYDVLYEITGQRLAPTAAAWRQWYGAQTAIRLRPLRRPPPVAW